MYYKMTSTPTAGVFATNSPNALSNKHIQYAAEKYLNSSEF